MIRLARIFKDYMVLQRNTPALIWGENDEDEIRDVALILNGKELERITIPAGEFTFSFPEQEAMEDAMIEIGDIQIRHVDFGEVWIAGGQSNMEFLLKYEQHGDKIIAEANDDHFRMYTVGQYSYPEQRQENYKIADAWDKWLQFHPESAGNMSAVSVYFARELRKKKVPVGIVSCNWGGTPIGSWLPRDVMLKDPDACVRVKEFEERVAQMNMHRYEAVKNIIWPMNERQEAIDGFGMLLKNTMHPDAVGEMIQSMMGKEEPSEGLPDDLTMEEKQQVGPGHPWAPSTLYENMMPEIIGYSNRGVLWYQGESDEDKAEIYDKLFGLLIRCWRERWKEKNTYQEKMPFLFVQLAPYGTWMWQNGHHYPELRSKQELISKTVEDTYMASISDIGNIFDIHPKDKEPVGKRLYLLAEKHIYGEKLLADAPEVIGIEQKKDCVEIYFAHCQGLHVVKEKFDSYNGFKVSEIPEEFLPPVLDGINGLLVILDGKVLENAQCNVLNDSLIIRAKEIENAKQILINFAQTAFYQVNIFNKSGIPVKPFILNYK